MRLYRVRPGGRWFRPQRRRLAVSAAGALAVPAGALLAAGLALAGELRAGPWALGAFAVLCALLGAAARPGAAPVIGGMEWLFYNGFAVHRYATVLWAGAAVEGGRLALLAGAALLAALPAAWPRRRPRVEWIRLSG
ncbi:hypothetical protein ACFYNO_03690 [Kitasatospora sp. NPDC006697]|uniref:hypothetical protein n=1 Tax=Kitasatospora sp. NPDC006697 TaxID=3364020 RepID=UPI00369CAA15